VSENIGSSMAFTIQLDPEMERRLVEQARLRDVPIKTYIQQILERYAAVERSDQELSDEEFKAALDAIAAYSDKIPLLSLDAFRRDEIY
jgi:predicted transcriptional regulator